jgi:hypothetical protein
MNGIVARCLAVAGLTGAVAASGCGPCIPARDAIDRCWPQRYNHVARKEVVDAFAPQVQNGHILDQTVWNYHFETGTDKLTPGGMMHLDTLSRRRPEPDKYLFLATARDLRFDIERTEDYAAERQNLDAKRIAAIQKYLNTQMAGRPFPFEVMVHDPYEVGMAAETAAVGVRKMRSGTTSVGGALGGAGNITGTGGSLQQQQQQQQGQGQVYMVPMPGAPPASGPR